MPKIYQHTFDNGLTLLAEPMEYVRSAAMNFLIPAGCASDPPKARGIASVLSDLITRGAGERGNHELTLALDNLGLDRSEAVTNVHMRFWGATVATISRPLSNCTPTSCAVRICPPMNSMLSKRWPFRTFRDSKTNRGKR